MKHKLVELSDEEIHQVEEARKLNPRFRGKSIEEVAKIMIKEWIDEQLKRLSPRNTWSLSLNAMQYAISVATIYIIIDLLIADGYASGVDQLILNFIQRDGMKNWKALIPF